MGPIHGRERPMLLRSTIALTLLLAAAACGGGDKPAPDAPGPDIGFNKPAAALKANANGVEIGPADLTCLGTPASDPATATAITLDAVVKDFQTGDAVAAVVTAFPNADVGQPFATATADALGKISIVVPMGTKRFGFKMTHKDSLDTLLLNQKVGPTTTPVMFGNIQIVSTVTANVLPAFIGKIRTAGTGVLAGAMRDCQDRDLSNFIAAVSSTPGTATHLPGADAYYFDPTAGLPVKHNVHESASADGLFMVIELAPTPTAYVQIWGYPTDADLAADRLALVAELAAPVIADTVITGSYEPLRTGQ
jgi:hypothetical protein